MPFTVKVLMIHVLPEETWYACTCEGGTNQCGQCTDISGDDLGSGDDEEASTSYRGGRTGAAGSDVLVALQEQLRQALAHPPGA